MSKLEKLLEDISQGVTITKVDLSNQELTVFPQELFQLEDTLEQLNLGNNRINALPEDIGRFKQLKILFFGQNEFESVPACLGDLKNLKMISFKSNRVASIHEDAFNHTVNWLILSDNKITVLPATIGKLTTLRKLMLAGNHLAALPDELAQCRELELVRISANRLTSLPSWLFQLPRLSWLAFAGNPLSIRNELALTSVKVNLVKSVDWKDLELLERIGEGASGFVHKAVWKHSLEGKALQEETVAVKLFKGDATSDGLPENEMEASEAIGNHAHFIPVLGRLSGAPSNQFGLLFPLVDTSGHKILGNPPSFDSITRDTFNAGTTFGESFVLNTLRGIASAAEHLHDTVGLMHGDLYAHNILVNGAGDRALLTDFGAASFRSSGWFDAREQQCLEGIEVRAFGCLVEDLLSRMKDDKGTPRPALKYLQELCLQSDVLSRPRFCDIVRILADL